MGDWPTSIVLVCSYHNHTFCVGFLFFSYFSPKKALFFFSTLFVCFSHCSMKTRAYITALWWWLWPSIFFASNGKKVIRFFARFFFLPMSCVCSVLHIQKRVASNAEGREHDDFLLLSISSYFLAGLRFDQWGFWTTRKTYSTSWDLRID